MPSTAFQQEPRVALFGPQVLRWSRESLLSLQNTIQQESRLNFIITTLIQLPALWPALVQNYDISDIGFGGGEKLKELEDFAAGRSIPDPQKLTNIQLAPLTVISQIAEFIQLSNDPDSSKSLSGFVAAQGFCIGFLSAAAVSSSSNYAELERSVSNSVRLAACIGGLLDSQDASNPSSECATAISVRWNTPSDRAYIDTCLDLFPDAYISCVTDDGTLTIGIPKSDQTSFCSRLDEMKISTLDIGLDGWFHHPRNADIAKSLKKFCSGNKELELPDALRLHLPLRSTADAAIITTGPLHEIAIDLVLCKRAHWFQTVQQTVAHFQSKVKLTPMGSQPCIPRSLLPSKLNVKNGIPPHANVTELASGSEEIAVVGMACRFPEADSIEEFWQLLASGKSCIGTVPIGRFDPADVTREPKLGNYWGNFMSRPDVFDHRFFGFSGREAKSMDPQQRLALQVAYEALESSGYFALSEAEQEAEIGCYMGVGAVEYEENIASEDANAFSATGTLRAFISGRISHFFGWTGPSITLDTACSSSSVAIHTACKALLAGECSMALAGGVNVITGPNLYQNLSGASFLNPNGSSRAFDAGGNGYCRGEGAGMLILKPLSKALSDCDTILGVISGSAVNQGSNCSSITVPDSQSQSLLYKKALSIARIEPTEVTYVEAHGTGTPVGDPIEYESVRSALTGPLRNQSLFLGSVKDNIGHLEAASGVAGVIKTLLMMQYRTIPKQANFNTLNPSIKALPGEQLEISTSTQQWIAQRHVALVNNYGAAGSNAAIVLRAHSNVSQNPGDTIERLQKLPSSTLYPIFLSSKSAGNLQSYINAMKLYLPSNQTSIKDIAYNIARRQNSSFEYRTAFTVKDKEDLMSKFSRLTTASIGAEVRTKKHPVIFCFGGQVGSTVTISKELFDSCDVLRKHLTECNTACKELGLHSIFPDIFLGAPIDDLVTLHCMLLSLQVSFARSWLDCGLQIDSLIGHSFGQLSALCIAGSISLKDAMRLISGRARLIRDSWGSERGVMISVECERKEIEAVVTLVNSTADFRVDIACYNGPRSYVLAGNTSSMARVEEECRHFKTTRLSNTHGYHSYLADGILQDYRKIAESVTIQPPRIPIETCSAEESWPQYTVEQLVQHTRQPVHFEDAVERIASRLPSASWLEAGSASPIIAMMRRILSKPGRLDTFIPVNLGDTDARENLANATCQLWKSGSNVQYWPFHRSSGNLYTNINLPPYQFEQTRHWIDYKSPSARSPAAASSSGVPSQGLNLVSLIKQSDSKGECLFLVDTSNVVFDLAGRGHAVASYGICPASMYVELAARCAIAIPNSDPGSETVPHVEAVTMSSPLGLGGDSQVFLRLRNTAQNTWDFTLFSSPGLHVDVEDSGALEHASGRIDLVPVFNVDKSIQLLNKFAGISYADRISKSPLATGISGPMVYDLFSNVVDYADYYRGVRSLYALENEAVGFVTLPADRPFSRHPTVCDPIPMDNFLQVAGIHVNCLSPRKEDEIFMCTAVEEVIFSASFMRDKSNSREWTVYSRFELVSKSHITNDIFVYDASSQTLVVAIMGATFKGVSRKSLMRNLGRLNLPRSDSRNPNDNRNSQVINLPRSSSRSPSDGKSDQDSGYHTPEDTLPVEYQNKDLAKYDLSITQSSNETSSRSPHIEEPLQEPDTSNGLDQQLCQMFSDIMEIPLVEIEPTTSLVDIGIDSLLVTEVIAEIQKRFRFGFTQAQFMECTDVCSLGRRIQPHKNVESSQGSSLTKTPSASSQEIHDHDTAYQKPAGEGLAVVCQDRFAQVKDSYDQHARTTGFTGFCSEVFPLQSRLVVQYVVEAFDSLGCSLQALDCGDKIPTFHYNPQHTKVVRQLHKILEEAGLIKREGTDQFRRTVTPISKVTASTLHSEILAKFPKHASETKLLHSTATRLADCLTGAADPIALLFGNAETRAVLGDVYANAPMFKTGSLLLVQYLASALEHVTGDREVRILELGAGTGGTTSPLVEQLAGLHGKTKFSYTFTDLSPSLVAAARRKFAKYPFMQYTVLNVEEDPESRFLGAYDIILSTNCIHATKDLVQSTTNIRRMLRANGVLCLVELTRNLFWFDLVFGLLEGWWLSNDGREHALANEQTWKKSLQSAGFNWVDWSQSASMESNILKVITASPAQPAASGSSVASDDEIRDTRQTMVFKSVDGLDLLADIYYPTDAVDSLRKLPVALMIHGGGHIMLSRKDVRAEQTQMLLERGFLPISVDYRLCPETTLLEGPMTDVVDALTWIRTVLPNVPLARRDVRVDGERVVSVGWSTGGHLAMTLAWTSISRGIRAPEAILAFYCPTDYEDVFWTKPNMPVGARDTSTGSLSSDPNSNSNSIYDLDDTIWEAVNDHPITAYNIPPTKPSVGGWLAPTDPRSRLALYMNTHGRALHVLLNGLDKSTRSEPSSPASADIIAVSPLAHVRNGSYSTPTFIIHPREDDLIPWQQAQRTWEAMTGCGIDAELRIVEQVPHLFDLYREYRKNKALVGTVTEGYDFLSRYI
ncbi:related to polyketide synthase [Rhynchosporium secalis]|uniref:Related to polyketide synthase n=1 Tax=Rhynchosporium secalis TaxID=38038 RepID=A0A1E1MJC5_RHYSE|nr:related to polyketide synthase [Rhynchosporium secalis]